MGLLIGQSCAPTLRIKRIRRGASIPAYQTAGSAGLDLAACLEAPVTIAPGETRMIPFGFCMSLPAGWEGQVRPRSGLASKFGITLPNSPGTIDCDYRGEVMAPLINLSREPFTVEPGMRVAQMVIAPVAQARVMETDDLEAPEDAPRPAVRGADLTRAPECQSFPARSVEVETVAVVATASSTGRFLTGLGGSSRTRGEGGFGSTGL